MLVVCALVENVIILIYCNLMEKLANKDRKQCDCYVQIQTVYMFEWKTTYWVLFIYL